MLRTLVIIPMLLMAAAMLAVGCSSESPKSDPAAYTKTVVNDAIELYKDKGREAALAHFNSPESVDGPWYVYVINEQGSTVAHPTIPENVGKNLNDEVGTDITGYYFGGEILAADEDGRWVSHTYLNPTTGRQESKHSWVVRHDGLLFGSGYYIQ